MLVRRDRLILTAGTTTLFPQQFGSAGFTLRASGTNATSGLIVHDVDPVFGAIDVALDCHLVSTEGPIDAELTTHCIGGQVDFIWQGPGQTLVDIAWLDHVPHPTTCYYLFKQDTRILGAGANIGFPALRAARATQLTALLQASGAAHVDYTAGLDGNILYTTTTILTNPGPGPGGAGTQVFLLHPFMTISVFNDDAVNPNTVNLMLLLSSLQR